MVLDKINEFLGEAKLAQEDHRKKIMEFFKKNPNPPDKDVHAFAEELGINEHKFEEYIYSVMGSIFAAGYAFKKGFTEKDADPKELKMGIKVEMEHTTDPLIAKRISLDHLSELSDYYTRLAKMEEEGKKAVSEGFKEDDSVTVIKGMHKGKKGTVASVIDYSKATKSKKKGMWIEIEFKDGSGKQLQVSDVKRS